MPGAWQTTSGRPGKACPKGLDNYANPTLQDGDFSEQRFRDIVNAYLANSVGNLLNRTLGLLRKNCAGALPASAADAAAPDHPLRAVAEAQVQHAHLLCVGTGGTLLLDGSTMLRRL